VRLRNLPVWLLPLVLVSPAARAEARDERGWEWTVRVAPEAARLEVRLCFQGFKPKRLALGLPAGSPAIQAASAAPGRYGLTEDGEGFTPVEAGGADGTAACLEYTVDVAALPAGRAHGGSRVGRTWMADPRLWLLAPALWPDDVRATLRMELPAGLSASVPWEPLAERTWRLPPSSVLGESMAALGPFTPRVLEVAGTRFEVAQLEGPVKASRAGVDRWLAAAAAAVAGLHGARFPAPHVQVVVQPAGPDAEPVSFGMSKQAGGAAVHLLLAADAADDALPGEWVAVHELTHLTMPWITPHDAWFTEGFVTYYQEVLRARAGFLGPEGPWQRLHEGFERGRRGGAMLTLAEESRRMRERHAFLRVYWGGAALALRCDLALRAASGGKRSLDDAMRLWAEPRFMRVRGWTGLDLLRSADEAFGTRALVESVRAGLESQELPPIDDLYAALGLTADGGRVRLSTDPAQRALRDAIGAKP
jgi:hypothetical protein